MSKIIFKNKKNIILIYFKIKNILKNNYYHTPKHNRYTSKLMLLLIKRQHLCLSSRSIAIYSLNSTWTCNITEG